MAELVQVNRDVYYLANHFNHGFIVVGDEDCVLIDSGMDDDVAQMVLAAIERQRIRLAAIINTHSHADHYGGNNYLVKKTGCKVYAPPLEAAIMMNPSLEPFYIYGADAPDELKQPFLMGKVSPVDVLLDEPSVTIGDKEFHIVSLKGHSPNQVGVLVDDVFFCSDSVFSEKAWEQLVLVYGMNIREMVASLERLKTTPAKSFVPAHATPTGSIDKLVDVNLTRIQALVDDILEILTTPADTTTVLGQIAARYKLTIGTMQQYYLCMNTLKAYLSYLLKDGLIAYELDTNKVMWRTTE